jgi:uncharacterized spore protein YtfJ
MSLSEVIKTALDQISYIAKTETVIGEPIQTGNVTLIPVSRVSIGFAAGGAGDESKKNSGSGTGGGVTVTPVAFISIVGDKIHVHPIDKKDTGLGQLLSLAPELMQKVSQIIGSKSGKDDKDSKAD